MALQCKNYQFRENKRKNKKSLVYAIAALCLCSCLLVQLGIIWEPASGVPNCACGRSDSGSSSSDGYTSGAGSSGSGNIIANGAGNSGGGGSIIVNSVEAKAKSAERRAQEEAELAELSVWLANYIAERDGVPEQKMANIPGQEYPEQVDTLDDISFLLEDIFLILEQQNVDNADLLMNLNTLDGLLALLPEQGILEDANALAQLNVLDERLIKLEHILLEQDSADLSGPGINWIWKGFFQS
jgi:hypothetical protein